MKFRPCIDLHNGVVKQIVGSSLVDGEKPKENFAAEKPSEHFAVEHLSLPDHQKACQSKFMQPFWCLAYQFLLIDIHISLCESNLAALIGISVQAMYRSDDLPGGHVIALGAGNEDAALRALRAYPGGLSMGGGINPENAKTCVLGLRCCLRCCLFYTHALKLPVAIEMYGNQ